MIKTIRNIITSIICLITIQTSIAQNKNNFDSLLNILKTTKTDTSLVNTYNKICEEYQNSNLDTALYYANLSLKLAIKVKHNPGIADSYNNIGNIKKNKGDYDKALEFFFKSLKIYEEIGYKKGMANSFNNIGIIYKYKAEAYQTKTFEKRITDQMEDPYKKALEFYNKGLKIYEEIGDKKGIGNSYNNLGNIYKNKGEYDRALELHLKSLKIKEEINDRYGMAGSYNNIGIIYQKKDKYDKALEFYAKSLKIREEIVDKYGIATSYINIGCLYYKQSNSSLTSLQKKEMLIKEAKKQQLLALNISKEIGAKDLIYWVYEILALYDSDLGNFKEAYEYHKLYSQMHDSVFTKESEEKIAEMSARYDSEKKQLQIDNLGKEKELQLSENKKQKIIILFVASGLLLVIVFSIFLFRMFIQKKKANRTLALQKQQIEIQNSSLQQANEEINTQKDEIESQRDFVTKQKEHIEEIHKEVTDSIYYAQKIQQAMLPDFEGILSSKTQIPNTKPQAPLESETWNMEIVTSPLDLGSWIMDLGYFVLFKPKDIVSGDFYFFAKNENILFIAVADCTGHGVPGAFMSMLGISFLNEIIVKENILSPAHILDELRKLVIHSLQQKGIFGEQKDGMDIAFIALNTETMELQFAGANNPIWIVKKLKVEGNKVESYKVESYKVESEKKIEHNFTNFTNFTTLQTNNFTNVELYELKGDKMPVAIHIRMDNFTNHTIQLQQGDTIYLMSDGFEDQFGGPKGKKFLTKQLKQLLITNSQKPMSEQKEILNSTFENWKGEHEQIDDVTIFGLRI